MASNRARITNSVILAKYISEFDGKTPMGVYLVKSTTNSKTGNIPTLSFMQLEGVPSKLRSAHQDKPSCGDCPLRSGGGCYVNLGFGPNKTHDSIVEEPLESLQHLTVKTVTRVGGYGDIMSCPPELRDRIFENIRGHFVGYSHVQDKELPSGILRSIEDPALIGDYHNRTARIVNCAEDVIPEKEILCPAITHSHITCRTCGFCGPRVAKSVAFIKHGTAKKRIKLPI
jgi:hypothetical protein